MKQGKQTILLTGGRGLLGKHLVPLLKDAGYKVIAPASYEMDITNTSIVFQAISWNNPDIVVHCAAYTDVPKCETPAGARQANLVNIHGSKNVIEGSHYFGAKVVYISTDYVYNGTGNHYTGDKTKPITYYGMTKLIGESFCCKDDLALRLSFKARGTWGADAYTSVPHPILTNADWVDVIAEKIVTAIEKDLKGIKNLGTKTKYLKDLALEEYQEVEEVRPETLNIPYFYPRNSSMKLDI